VVSKTIFRPAASVATCLLLSAAASGQPQPSPAATARPSCAAPVAWSELRFEAHKLLLTATAVVQSETLPAHAVAGDLRTPPQGEGRAPAGPCVTVLRLSSDVPIGRDETATAWLDADDGGVLQVDKVATGRGAFRKVFRYSDAGFFMWRSAPADDAEERGDPQRWSKRKTEAVTATRPAGDLALTDSYALLYLVSRVPRERVGVISSALMFADDRLSEVTFRVEGLSLREVDLRLDWPGGERRIDEKRLLRRISVAAAPLGAGRREKDVDLGFLGMKGELVVWVDMETGLPVELDGRADTVGRLRVTLERATLREKPGGD